MPRRYYQTLPFAMVADMCAPRARHTVARIGIVRTARRDQQRQTAELRERERARCTRLYVELPQAVLGEEPCTPVVPSSTEESTACDVMILHHLLPRSDC